MFVSAACLRARGEFGGSDLRSDLQLLNAIGHVIGICVGRCFQERRSAMDGGRRSSYMDVLVRGPENSLRRESPDRH